MQYKASIIYLFQKLFAWTKTGMLNIKNDEHAVIFLYRLKAKHANPETDSP